MSEATTNLGGVSTRVRNYTLGVLVVVYAFNFIDRQILVIMQELIKEDLGLSDTQLGLLSGFSFAIFYVTAGIPIARFADRANRRNIVAASLAIWSGMTAISGLVQNYWQLLLARIGVGIGEAGCSPPAHSMISDMYPPEKRATALSIYSSGLYFGIVLGFLFGGWLSELIGWRATFLVIGLPGVALAVVMWLTVPEPIRSAGHHAMPQQSFAKSMQEIWRYRSFPYFSLGCAFAAFVGYGVGNFVPSFLIRYHGMSPGEVGTALALTGGFGGMIGTFAGGWLSDRLGMRDVRWYLWVAALGGLAAIPLYIGAFWAGPIALVLGLYFFGAILSAFYLAPSIAMAHRLVAPNQRAMASAVLFFVLNLIGLGLGPAAVGAVSDLLREISGQESLRTALTIGTLVAVVKVVLFLRGAQLLHLDLKDRPAS